jgi:hypothetical protein
VVGFVKVHYRGLKKNTHWLLVTCALAICSWRAGIYCAATARNLSDVATNGLHTTQMLRQERHRHPILSLAAAISMPVTQPPAPCSDLP